MINLPFTYYRQWNCVEKLEGIFVLACHHQPLTTVMKIFDKISSVISKQPSFFIMKKYLVDSSENNSFQLNLNCTKKGSKLFAKGKWEFWIKFGQKLNKITNEILHFHNIEKFLRILPPCVVHPPQRKKDTSFFTSLARDIASTLLYISICIKFQKRTDIQKPPGNFNNNREVPCIWKYRFKFLLMIF